MSLGSLLPNLEQICHLFGHVWELISTICFLATKYHKVVSILSLSTRFDNPAAYSPPQTRRLTHLYLVFFNLALLFYPSTLCADWTMGSIPLITSFNDTRNIATLCTFTGLLVVALRCASPWTPPRQALTLSMVSR